MVFAQGDSTIFDYTISVSCIIKLPKQTILEQISTPGIVSHYHPFCKDNPVENWNTVDRLDKIVYESGIIYHRQFNEWYEGIGYDLTIIENGIPLADVYWRINEVENSSNELRITLKLGVNEILPNVPKIFRWIPYYIFIRWQMKSYLTHVVTGFKHYITTGEKVTKNQFGRHRLYSEKQ